MASDLRRAPLEGCLSDLQLDELAAGELPTLEAERAAAHLRSCERCAERERSFREVARAFLELHPEAPARASMRAAPTRARGQFRALLVAGVVLAAVAVLFVRAERAPMLASERAKGGARLGFYVKRGARVFQGADGERVQAGDQLRFVVNHAAGQEIAILSRDASGTASVYYPRQTRSVALDSAPATVLDAAVELDATLGPETLYGIFCSTEFEIEPLRRALEETGTLPSPRGCTVDQLELIKEAH